MSKIKALFWLLIGILLTTSAFAAGPVISGIAVSSVTSNSAVIVWTTSPAATSQVFYGVGNTSQSSAKSFALVTSHSITIAVLSQQTVYTYEVQSTDSGGTTTSSTNTFALCNPGNPNSGLTAVTASENASYVTGTVTATWTNTSGVSTSTPTLCGNTFSTSQTGTVGLPGNFGKQLPDNNYIVPSPSEWTFTQSNASGLSAEEIVNGPQVDFTSAFGLQASASSPGSAAWGSITGTLSNQTDLETALNLLAPLASPALTGTPTAPTQTGGDNTTALATDAFVQTALGPLGTPFNVTGSTSAISSTTLFTPTVAGFYVVQFYYAQTVACVTPGSGGVLATLTYEDDTGTATTLSPVIPELTFSPVLPNNSQTQAANIGLPLGPIIIWATAHPISFATTYSACTTGTVSYDMHVAVYHP